MSFSDEEIDRYARHIVLHEIGGPGQQKLRKARVLVIGAGGLGSPAIQYLAAAGVGEIGVVDDDTVSLSNLQRQVLHGTDEVGAPKVESAERAVARLNPHVRLVAHPMRLTRENGAAMVAGHDVVLDGCDNFMTRYLVNELCTEARVPLVSGAIGRWEGQLSVFRPWLGGPCYACVFPEAPPPGTVPACSEAGVLGAMAGVVGAMQAVEAVKLIVGAGEVLDGRMMLYDSLSAEARNIRLKRRRECSVCSSSASASAEPSANPDAAA